MKLVTVLLAAILLVGCSSMTHVQTYSGSWICTNSQVMSMMVLRPDSSCILYKYVGSPWSGIWEGYWRMEQNTIVFLNQKHAPISLAHFSGDGRFYMYLEGDVFNFHRYGAALSNWE